MEQANDVATSVGLMHVFVWKHVMSPQQSAYEWPLVLPGDVVVFDNPFRLIFGKVSLKNQTPLLIVAKYWEPPSKFSISMLIIWVCSSEGLQKLTL